MPTRKPKFTDSVFINCPFDEEYWPIFEAIIFCIIDCGFVPRCSLESPDSGETRVKRIHKIIQSCMYSIHDISRVQLTPKFPRFNMPFEVGLDLGCREYGTEQLKRKKCLILDTKRYRYQEFFSDISGQDIQSHNDSPDVVITLIRNWLRAASRRKTIPGQNLIKKRFTKFSNVLPKLCDDVGLDKTDIQFVEYVTFIEEWLKTA